MRVTPPGPAAARPERSRRPAGRAAARRWAVLAACVVVIVLLAATAALAQETQPPAEVPAVPGDLNTVLNNIRNWIMGILAGLGTVCLTVGGVRYLMSAGEPGEVAKAKDAFKNAAWGYGLAALAPLAVEILKGIVGA